jgi:hypothetical protein
MLMNLKKQENWTHATFLAQPVTIEVTVVGALYSALYPMPATIKFHSNRMRIKLVIC